MRVVANATPLIALGILLAAVLAGLLSKVEALDDLRQLSATEIRISSHWQDWLRDQLDRL